MYNGKVKANHGQVRKLLRSDEMADICFELASDIADRAGKGYAADKKKLSTRVIASAYTETFQAMRDDMENKTLLKAMRG